ncbi:MAG: rhomboid family intramembrane serine protease [Peptoniphilaceae bacterium]|nr:rhomboid family intramembrane serine protease [Anaerococcus sp.]MDD7044378.1 rhomboid family intramembrane serine protease [Peptoniphilaceae bacterium]
MSIKKLGETPVTTILLIANVIVFVLMTFSGGSENTANLIRFGAMAKPLVYEGGWWRVITASFIHIGFLHILFNMYFLYSIGPVFERLYGPYKFLVIYILAGAMGNLFTYAFGRVNAVSAGASTSLYGIFGLAIGLMINYKDDAILSSFGASFMSIIVINVIYSLISPNVGIMGHLGGFLGGVLLAGVFPVTNRSLPTITIAISAFAFILLSFLFVRIGNNSLMV